MRKKLIIVLLLILLFGITGRSKKEEKENDNKQINEVTNQMKIIINNEKYNIELEQNETVKELLSILPIELTMNELNGNEKYAYLDTSLSKDSIVPERINRGDVMLYGDNCLVLFYESFDTTYSYTKIGHVNDLPNLGKDSITVKIDKE